MESACNNNILSDTCKTLYDTQAWGSEVKVTSGLFYRGLNVALFLPRPIQNQICKDSIKSIKKPHLKNSTDDSVGGPMDKTCVLPSEMPA